MQIFKYMNLHKSYAEGKCTQIIAFNKERIEVHLYITIKVGNQLVLLMTHPTPEVGYSNICLLTVSEITLWNQNVTHGQHSKPSNFFRGVENDRWKPDKRNSMIDLSIKTQ